MLLAVVKSRSLADFSTKSSATMEPQDLTNTHGVKKAMV